MSCLKDEMIAFLTADEIRNMVKRLAKEIMRDYAGHEIAFVCPLKGSFMFLSDLSRAVELPQTIDFVQLATTEKGGSIRLVKDISENITGKHVLIVEEIIDVGRSVNFLKTRLMASSPASVKVVCLLDKPARRETQMKPDYIGVTIDDRYMVGYGMDSEECGRNYKEIYYFKQ